MNRRKIVIGVVSMALIALVAIMAIATLKKIAVGTDKTISSEQFK